MVSPGRACARAARIDSPACTTRVRASAANAQHKSAQIPAIRVVISPPGREDRTPRQAALPSPATVRCPGALPALRDDEPDDEGDRRRDRRLADLSWREAELADGSQRGGAQAFPRIADDARLRDRAVGIDGQTEHPFALHAVLRGLFRVVGADVDLFPVEDAGSLVKIRLGSVA